MATVLRINTVYSRLDTDDVWLKEKLWKSLRFRDRNYFHATAYRQKKWDGYINFFTREAGQFLTGLLPEVVYALKLLGVEYTVQDNRNPIQFLRTTINEDFLWRREHPKPIVLRDYQIDLVNQSLKYKRGVIHAPTSSGKTACLLSILACMPPKTPALVLVDTKGLVQQNYDELVKFGFTDVGMFYSDSKTPNYITVCLVNSAKKFRDQNPDLFNNIKVLIVDEIHDMMSKRCIEIYKQLRHADVRIGFSATPFKFGGKDACQKFQVKGHIGPIIETSTVEGGRLTTAVLQGKDILSTAQCVFYTINEPERPYDIYQDAVTYGIAQNEYLNQAVARLVKNKLTGRTLIVVERIEHGERLMKLIPNAFWLHGNQKKDVRSNTIEGLKHHKGDFVAIAVDKIVNKGINMFIHNLVNCAGGKADHQVIQRMGRGLRTAADKEGLRYYDFFFTINPYLEKHSEERIRVLEREGHKIEIKEDFDF